MFFFFSTPAPNISMGRQESIGRSGLEVLRDKSQYHAADTFMVDQRQSTLPFLTGKKYRNTHRVLKQLPLVLFQLLVGIPTFC